MSVRTVWSLGNFSRAVIRTATLRCVQTAHRRVGIAVKRDIPGRRGSRGTPPCVMTPGRWAGSRDCSLRPPFFLMSCAAFSIFSKLREEDEDLSEPEQEIVYLLKKAKLSIMKDEMDEAEELLHKTLHLAQECKSKRAILYTYDLMANLALLRGRYDTAEKLFKTTMVYMLDSGIKQDDNSFLEISLKLASIFAAQNQKDLAVAGYQFCILSLDTRTKQERDLPEEVMAAEEKTNTRLLLGLCLDSYARYLVSESQLLHAQVMYEKALKICKEEQGDLHPQTITLLNDLATVMEAQGRYDEAYTFASQALHLAEKADHPDHHIMLSNMAAILMHQGKMENLVDAERIFRKALMKAEEKKDAKSVQFIQEGLSKLARQKKEKGQNI
ncbi:PREDICTED: tetratricopeptide repeat protein 19, mitochondrial [Nanorana parkeri]|uniref:tetratricopeptide repeat protein 19, mitochondrial n=1 Tax=Nanorana parkeri TaxID=125878 RepID=UPI0008548166|nr:PREDICTED: tetratricopeptide repeat protein 19, mitochondrial [Nanorana parkeri]